MKKFILIISVFLLFFYFSINYAIRKPLLKSIKNIFSEEKKILIKKTIFPHNYINELENDNNYLVQKLKIEKLKIPKDNDYNTKFLPETQFINLKFYTKFIKLNDNFLEKLKKNKWNRHSFYIEEYLDKIIIADYYGNFYYFSNDKLVDDKLSINLIEIISNFEFEKVLDIKIIDQQIYVSHVIYENNCQYLSIYESKINFENLAFKDFFTDKTCGQFLQAGRMVDYNHKNINGMLISTSDQIPDDTDVQNPPSQNEDSFFGKILFFDLKKKEYEVFSKGHRNIQGLYSENGLILTTEHGPRGGDEINKIILDNNYGWPISSYGEKYSYDENILSYKKNHKKYNFTEPIYAYVPSIGISEIIRLDNKFSKHFKNNFIVSTLADQHIYRIKFDDDFNKILFQERIFIGNRIRDLKYINNYNLIILALEDNLGASFGVLSSDLSSDYMKTQKTILNY